MRRQRSAVLTALFAAWLGAGPQPGLGAESDGAATAARQEWMLGFLKLEPAAAAVREQRPALARELYGEALQRFTDVARRFPAWNPDLVSYRVTHCQEQLRLLDEAVAAALDTMDRADLIAEVRRGRDRRQGVEAQAQSLAAQVERLQTELDEALRSARARADEAAQASAELAQIKERENALQKRAEGLAADLKAREADLARLQAAAGDTAALRTSLADLGRQAESARQWQQQASVAETKLKDSLARAADLADQLDRAQRQAEAVRSEREYLSRVAAESKDRAAGLERTQREALAEAATGRTRLEAARQATATLTERYQEADGRAAAATRELEDLKVAVANLKTEVQALQPGAVAALREAHTEALRQVAEQRANGERWRTELSAARDAEQRLTAERESALRTTQEAAQAANRLRLEQKQLEEAAGAALARGDAAAAEPLLRQLLEANPREAAVAARLGKLLADRGDAAAAEPLLQAAWRGQPDDVEIALRLGLVLLRQAKAMSALAVLFPASAAAPARADIQHFLGVAMAETGWREGAEKAFARAFELDARRADTAFCMAALLATSGTARRTEAQTWYERALALGAARDAGLDRYFATDN